MARPSPQTDRLVAIVELLASRQGDGLSLSDIARRLGTTAGTCHPMMASLLKAGWVVRHPTTKSYQLGPALAVIGQSAAAGFSALELCHPIMVGLQQEHGLTCFALVPGAEQATIVDMVRDPRTDDGSLRIGDTVPFHPPLGLSYIAWQSPKAIKRWISRSDDTENRQRYQRLLEVTRERGYSIDLAIPDDNELRQLVSKVDHLLGAGDEASPAQFRAFVEQFASLIPATSGYSPAELDPKGVYRVGAISAPVFDRQGNVTLMLALRGFADRVTGGEIDRIGRQLATAAITLTEQVGGNHPAKLASNHSRLERANAARSCGGTGVTPSNS
jgi:DNA-binding IclR family transcriptional regulator